MAGASLSYLLLLSMTVLNGGYCCLSCFYFGILFPISTRCWATWAHILLCFTDYISFQMNLPEYVKEHTPNKHKKNKKQKIIQDVSLSLTFTTTCWSKAVCPMEAFGTVQLFLPYRIPRKHRTGKCLDIKTLKTISYCWLRLKYLPRLSKHAN